MARVYSVSQLNRSVALAIQRIGAAGLVAVQGEISGPRVTMLGPGRPMVFFALREGEESLSCVSFGRQLDAILRYDPQTGEVFSPPKRLEDVFAAGTKVICQGLLGTYTRKGQSLFQLSVSAVSDCGAGERARRIRELRKRLQDLGYFDDARKRPLPRNPSRIALLTSETGAVIHDFLRVAQTRGFGTVIVLYPVRVQGEGAGAEIARAVRAAGSDPRNQCVVVIRGGGSEDDLACFDDEDLAAAIYRCPVPVLAGIGHEVDFSSADLTADVRASTPTQAAQILWTPREEAARALDETAARLDGAARRLVSLFEERVGQTERMLRSLSPQARLDALGASMDDAGARLDAAMARLAGRCREGTDACAERLRRAGAMLLDGLAREEDAARASLVRAAEGFVAARERDLETVSLTLEAASPLKPLERGFALVEDASGRVVRSVAGLAPGAAVRTRLLDGSFDATVVGVSPGKDGGAA